jgi:hypothetical protein
MAEYSLNSCCRRFPGSAQGGRYLLNFDSVADRAILQALLAHNTTLGTGAHRVSPAFELLDLPTDAYCCSEIAVVY